MQDRSMSLKIDFNICVRTIVTKGLWMVLFWVCAISAHAQQGDEIQLEPEDAMMACLLPAAAERGTPAYPEPANTLGQDATIKVRLTFTSRDSAPSFKFIPDEKNSAFESVVGDFIKRYRLPCFDPGLGPVRATQEFRFRASTKNPVEMAFSEDAKPGLRKSCFSTVPVKYPARASGAGSEGNVLLEIKFLKRNVPPVVRVLYASGIRDLQAAAVNAAKEYVLGCDIGEDMLPLTATQLFAFRIDGNARVKLRDVTLPQFLRALDRSNLRGVRFDFTTMGCPFDVNIAMRQPYAYNYIVRDGRTEPSQSPFLAWLTTLTMKFPKESEALLVGESIKISVPCMILDLT